MQIQVPLHRMNCQPSNLGSADPVDDDQLAFATFFRVRDKNKKNIRLPLQPPEN